VLCRLQNGIILCAIMVTLAACVAAPPVRALKDITQFSENVAAVTDLFSVHLDNVEKAHLVALKENTALQFDLGGNPAVESHPLFSYQAKAYRKKLLEILSTYAQNLKSVYPAGQLPSGDIVGQVQKIENNILDFSHGIDMGDQAALIQSLNGTAAYIFASYQESQIGDIIRKAHPLVERAALLLYLDIGSPEHQAQNCESLSSSHYINLKVGDLRLCRGGLRSLLKQAASARITALRQRLQLLRNDPPYSRQSAVNRLYDTQRAAQILDQGMQKTQEALLKLVAAHRDLRRQYAREDVKEGDILPGWSGTFEKGKALSELTDLMNMLPAKITEGAALLEGS